jgi:hypothetical protein
MPSGMNLRIIALSLVWLACCATNRGTTGHNGAAEFHYTACRADTDTQCTQQHEPIAAGGAQVYVTATSAQGCGGSIAFATAASSDSSIFTATASNGIIIVTSANPGQADLRLLDSHGSEIDRTTLTVEAVAKIAVAEHDVTTATLVDGFTQTVHFDRFDSNGAVLMGYGGIAYSMPTSAVIDIAPPDPDDGHFYGSPVAFHGADGAGQIGASAGTASTTFPVAFVDPSLITTVIVGPQRTQVVEKGHSLTEIDAAGAVADGTAVFGALCTWTPASGNVSQYSDPSLEHFDARFDEDTALRRSYFEGTGSATCTVGAASQLVTIR